MLIDAWRVVRAQKHFIVSRLCSICTVSLPGTVAEATLLVLLDIARSDRSERE